MSKLSYIEIKYLKAICSDKTQKDIATELHITESGLYNIYERIRNRLDIKTRPGLMMYAIENKIYQ